MQKVVIIGATSAIAEATARLYAARGAQLFLVARNAARLEDIAADLRVRGARETFHASLDINHVDEHARVVEQIWSAMKNVDVVLMAHGTLPDQAACEDSVDLTMREFATNGSSTLALLTLVAQQMSRSRSGTLAVVTSVAGDRGRQSNYVYGAAKAATSTFLSGLRQRLYKQSIHVVDVRPGFVDTPMTASFNKGALWATPAKVAAGIVKAIDRGTPVAYVPFFWAPIMLVIRHIPNRIFRRLSL